MAAICSDRAKIWPSYTPLALAPQDRCSFSAIGAPTTLSRALFLGSKCEINARDRAKGIADLSPIEGRRLDRPAVALTKSRARRSSSIAHTSQHARSPWIPSLSLFHAKRKEAMAMSCKFVGKERKLDSHLQVPPHILHRRGSIRRPCVVTKSKKKGWEAVPLKAEAMSLCPLFGH